MKSIFNRQSQAFRTFKLLTRSYCSKMTAQSGEIDLRSMRTPYKDDTDVLLEDNLPTRDPIELFRIWFEDAKKCPTIKEPNAVCLTTSTRNGIPSSRMVLLKAFGPSGFKIFTNLSSRKGSELKENPNASLLFYWDAFNKQVRIDGKVTFLSDEEAEDYFKRRPRISQLGAAASDQSKPIDSRAALIKKYNELDEKYANSQVERPKEWGGISLLPHHFEFWQGQSSRLHDRIVFERSDSQEHWKMLRLQP